MQKAIDKESIAKYLLDGTMTATDGPFTSDSEYALPSSNVTSYNEAEAKQILESAGYVDTDGDGYTDIEEIKQGTDPANPKSYPGSNNQPVSHLPVKWIKHIFQL